MSRVVTYGETISGYGDREGGSLDIISETASSIYVTGYDKADVFFIDATAAQGKSISVNINDDGGANDITVRAAGGNDGTDIRVERTEWDGVAYTFSDAPTSINLDASTDQGMANNYAQGWDGADRIIARASANWIGATATATNNLFGFDGDDVIRAYAVVGGGGSFAANFLDGGAGDDSLYAKVSVSDGASVGPVYSELYGGQGNDSLRAVGGEGSILNGGAGNDTLRSSGALDTLTGGAGDDTIRFDAPQQAGPTISGGAGNDRITVVLDPESHAQMSSAIEGGAGNDRISLKAEMHGSGGPSSGHFTLAGGNGADTISGTLWVSSEDNAESSPNGGVLWIEGGDGDDRLSGTIHDLQGIGLVANSNLYGGAGNDRLTVRGGEGNILNGGAGNDTLIGGSGSDTLIGLQGDDALQGKGGADIFLFGFIRSGERDRIADFVIGEDVIDLSQIDANRDRGGEQSFRFGTREGTGRAWIEEDPDTTGSILYADDGHRVLEVLLKDGRGVSAEDYSAAGFLL